MIKNQAGQSIGAQMVNATTGAAFVGTVTVYITIDAGVQVIGSVGGGVCTGEGNGYYSYLPSQAETNGNLVAFTFIGTGAIPVTIQVATITTVQAANLAGGLPGATSTSARAIITDAFLTLGVFEPGEALSSADANFGFQRLQTMQSAWKLQPLTSPTNIRQTFPIVAGKGSSTNPYSVGPGGDINTVKPVANELTGWGLILGGTTPGVEVPRPMMTDDAYQAIQVKDLTNVLFTGAYYNPTYASGLGTLFLWPVPDNSNNTLVLYRNQSIVNVVSLDASYDLPEGYFDALSYNLAVRLAKPYGQQITPDLDGLARQTLAVVKRANVRLTDLQTDPALTHDKRGGYNILTGTGG